MSRTNVELDPHLLARARELTGVASDRAVLELALRLLIASKQKSGEAQERPSRRTKV